MNTNFDKPLDENVNPDKRKKDSSHFETDAQIEKHFGIDTERIKKYNQEFIERVIEATEFKDKELDEKERENYFNKIFDYIIERFEEDIRSLTVINELDKSYPEIDRMTIMELVNGYSVQLIV